MRNSKIMANGDEDLEIKDCPVDNEDDAWCQCVSGEEEEGGESLSIQNWPYPTTTSTRYTYPPLKPPPNTTQNWEQPTMHIVH